jgi:hypothetical protein
MYGGNALFPNVTMRGTYNNHWVKWLEFGERYFAQVIRSTTVYNTGLQTGFDFWKLRAFDL